MTPTSRGVELVREESFTQFSETEGGWKVSEWKGKKTEGILEGESV